MDVHNIYRYIDIIYDDGYYFAESVSDEKEY